MASNAPGSEAPVITPTSTWRKSMAADEKQAPASPTAAAITEADTATVYGYPVSDAAPAFQGTTPVQDTNADILLQMLSNMATYPAICSAQGAVSLATDEEWSPCSYGKSIPSRTVLAKPRGTRSISASSPKQRAEEEAEALKQLTELAQATSSPTALPPSPNRGRRRCRDKCAGVAVVLLGVAVLAVSLALLLSSRTATHSADASVCVTTGCVDHAEILGLHRKGSGVGPCEDFGKFVCSHWTEKRIKVVPSVTIYRTAKWLFYLARSRWYEDTGNRVAARVTRFIDACMHRESKTGTHTDGSIKQLFDFMTEELFPWLLPDANNNGDGDRLRDDGDYAFTLATIVNMSVVWYVPLWFTVDLVIPLPEDGAPPAHRSVSISSTSNAYFAQRKHEEVEDYKLYDMYVTILLDHVFPGEKFAPAFRTFLINRSAEVQRNVFRNLSARYVASHVEPRFVEMRHLPALVPKLDARDWVDALQSAFGTNPPFTEEDTLFTTDAGLLHAVNVLFASYTARELTFHTAWWFAQIMAAVSSDRIHAFIRGNKVGDDVYAVFCGSHTANAYSVLLSGVDHGTGTASANPRSPVRQLLSNVHETAVGKVRTWTSALGSQAIDAVSSRLGSATTVVWPEGKENKSGSAWWGEALYGPDYDNATRGFFGHWREIRRRLQGSLNTDAYQSSLRVFRLQSSYLATYDVVSNAISVGVQAVTEPFYVADGTSAINYGGLGFLYALQVARTINTLTLLLDGHHTPSARVPPTNATDASGAPGQVLWKLGRCTSSNASAHVTSLYPALPALEIAHDAYKRFRDVTQDVPLWGLEAYTAEQVFFLTACHVTCWADSSDHRMSPECTDAMSNFAPFAEAFGCPVGSPMNPHEKCRFF
ncbi:hypothetical protein HPB49_018708 [Dermacentor silvarum]|uniref:Uncharacterized protein n=1 Tax=Dermacentor silvarum TaxID=543639 RepID=A0ACB8DKZ5_DERSI|nr:hypothetical protein HPB49_018708 [Dermacentor silvarum]